MENPRCLYCDNVFSANGTKWCCKTHQRRWETDHAVCWHPEKSLAFYVEEDAYDFIKENEDTLFVTNLHPFLCGCGMYHLGHSIKENA